MSTKLLTRLLDFDEHKFSDFIERLERACQRPGVDVRLSTEIATQVRQKIRALGLDESDTTPKELFHALQHKLTTDEAQLRTALHITPRQSRSAVATTLCASVTQLSRRDMSLSLTGAALKRILAAVPPKRTMKLLKLRSLESVLKREDPKKVYALAYTLEGASWHTQVHAKLRRIHAKDVQWQPVQCFGVSEVWYDRLHEHIVEHGVLVSSAQAGCVCIMPVAKPSAPGSVVFALATALQAASLIATQSLPYRATALLQGYPEALQRISRGIPALEAVHGLVPGWSVVHRIGADRPELLAASTDFQLEDLYWEATEVKMAALAPAMDFWVDSHFLGVATESRVVSLHVLDVAYGMLAERSFAQSGSEHLQHSLWNELQARYLNEDVMAHVLQRQLTKYG